MAAAAAKSIALVVTSNRSVRLGPSVGAFLSTLLSPAALSSGIGLRTVDVAAFNLPVYSEPVPPRMLAALGTDYEQAASRAWAREMASHDAYILLVNEYNGGMSGATKNAIDYLWDGFVGKPAMVVSYGGGGGGAAAGEQARAVLSSMGLRVVEPRVPLALSAGSGGGGGGGDVMLAVREGRLGDASREAWAVAKGGELREAFGNLLLELGKPVSAAGGPGGTQGR